MRTSPRHSPRYPDVNDPPGTPLPDYGVRDRELPYRDSGGAPYGQSYTPGYDTPLLDEAAYARALYGNGDSGYGDGIHAGPGTGLGYADAGWGQAQNGVPWYTDPDATDPDLAGSAYARAMYGGQAAPPMEDPALGHQGPWYDPSSAAGGFGYDPSALPYPGHGGPDATGPLPGDREQVDLAYYGPTGEPAPTYGPYAPAEPQPPYGPEPASYGLPPGYVPAAYAPPQPAADPGLAGWGRPASAPAEPDYYDDELGEDAGPDELSLPVRQLHRRSLGRAASRRASELVNGAGMTIIGGIVAVIIGVGLAIVAGRMMTTRQLFFTIHATAGILCVHAFGGGLTTLVLRKETRTKELVRKWSTIAMAGSAWVTMFVGTFFGYAGYRAEPRPGVVNLNAYPQKFLLADKGLAFWETFGMEWKVNSGWLCPFLATAVAFVVLRYNHLLIRDLRLRRMLTNLFLMAFAIAIVGSMMGFIINTVAPNDFMHRPWQP
jgi:cytochrome b561